MSAKIIAFPKGARPSPLSLSAIRAIEAITVVDARYRNTELEENATKDLDGIVFALQAIAAYGPAN